MRKIMKKASLNFIIDLTAFINLLALAFIGSIMKYVLPPGTGGQGRAFRRGGGFESLIDPQEASHIRQFLSFTRHQWGDIHFVLAILFIVLMVIHIILHWSWIKCYLKSLFQEKPPQ